jgi:cardiolipin synthase
MHTLGLLRSASVTLHLPKSCRRTGKSPHESPAHITIPVCHRDRTLTTSEAWRLSSNRCRITLEHFLELLAFVIPFTHAIGALFAIHALLFARTSQGAVAWTLSLVFFPYVAIILYLVFGRSKFRGYVEARRMGDRDIDHLADNLVAALSPTRLAFAGDMDRFQSLENLSLLPFTTGNSARLLVDGTATFDAIFDAITSAKSYLLVQFFIIRDDALGRRLLDALTEKAAQGVKVRLLYDEIGCVTLPRGFFNKLRHAGGHARAFNTRRGWRNRFQINFRNHRKIVIADGYVAFVGGHNVGTEYLGQSKRFGRWRDTHVEVRGPAVAAIQWVFIEDWHWATRETLDLPYHAPARDPLPPAAYTPEFTPPSCPTLCLPTGPADDIRTCSFMFLALISTPKKRLWITSPYFVPDETVYDALQLAALRGVDVRIMLPSKPDHLLVYLSAFSYLHSAEFVGVKFYRYRGGFLHQKVLLVDDDLAAVGTANLDNRSMRLNFEITLLFADAPFAAQVAAMLEEDFTQCDRATPGDLGRRGLPFQVAVRIARLLSPIQ